jgi:hypothetical protein
MRVAMRGEEGDAAGEGRGNEEKPHISLDGLGEEGKVAEAVWLLKEESGDMAVVGVCGAT